MRSSMVNARPSQALSGLALVSHGGKARTCTKVATRLHVDHSQERVGISLSRMNVLAVNWRGQGGTVW